VKTLSLSQYVRLFLANPQKIREEQQAPVLVWEAPPLDQPELLLRTQAGAQAPSLRSGEGWVFQVTKVPGKVNAFASAVTLGRLENNDIVLRDNSVSRFHAYLQQEAKSGQWRLFDADSKHGTWLNGTRMQPKQAAPVNDLAELKVGEVELFFFLPKSFFEYVQGHLHPTRADRQ
jgi:hypothetical protein